VVESASRAAPATAGAVTLAGVEIPELDETKHFKVVGTTGSGKSTAIRELVKGALARGDRAIIADPDGGYLGRFYHADRGDVIRESKSAPGGDLDIGQYIGQVVVNHFKYHCKYSGLFS
jgi:DNA helicase HerA-like ATPase